MPMVCPINVPQTHTQIMLIDPKVVSGILQILLHLS
jgi:hypothetical protein